MHNKVYAEAECFSFCLSVFFCNPFNTYIADILVTVYQIHINYEKNIFFETILYWHIVTAQ